MQDNRYGAAVAVGSADEGAANAFVAKVFGWMFLGLLVTCVSTFLIMLGINVSDAFANFIMNLSRVVLVVFLIEVLLVGVIHARVAKMNPATATLLYIVYSALNGFTLGLFALLYAGSMQALGVAFGVTAVSFGAMSVYGLVTKSDVTRFGNLFKMGLIGVILLSVVNIFLRNGAMEFVICIVGLFVFLGLTAYDTNRIKNVFAKAAHGDGAEGAVIYETDARGEIAADRGALAHNLAIIGALMLYLDFINMFLFILRLFGGGRK